MYADCVYVCVCVRVRGVCVRVIVYTCVCMSDRFSEISLRARDA